MRSTSVADPAIAVGFSVAPTQHSRRCAATYPACPQPHRAAEAAAVQAARASSHAALIRSYWIVGGSGRGDADPAADRGDGDRAPGPRTDPDHERTRRRQHGSRGRRAPGHRDELGDMARAVLVFKEHMLRGNQLAAEQEAERHNAEREKRTALVNMAATIEAATGSALQQIGERTAAMAATADAMSASANRTGDIGPGCRRRRRHRHWASRRLSPARPSRLAASIREIDGQVESIHRRPSGVRWRPEARPAPRSWR